MSEVSSPASDVAGILSAEGLGVFAASTGWSVHVGREPATPDTAITVYDTGGLGADTSELDVFRSTVQVRVRSKDYRAGYAKALAVQQLLLHTARQMIGAATYIGFDTTSDILPLGRDENNRERFTLNFRVLRQHN